MKIHLSPGNDHDSKHALELLSDLSTSERYVIADKAYGSKQIREYIEAQAGVMKYRPSPTLLSHGFMINGDIKSVFK